MNKETPLQNGQNAFQRYGLIAQGFHWLVALLIFSLFVTMAIRHSTSEETSLFWLRLHMSLGILVFLLTLLRLGWRKLAPPPPMEAGPAWSQTLANLAHVLLNLATLLIPLFGYLRVATGGFSTDFFGYGIPSVTGKMESLHEWIGASVHGEPMALFLLALIVLHVLAALWHQYIWKDNVLHRMLPW